MAGAIIWSIFFYRRVSDAVYGGHIIFMVLGIRFWGKDFLGIRDRHFFRQHISGFFWRLCGCFFCPCFIDWIAAISFVRHGAIFDKTGWRVFLFAPFYIIDFLLAFGFYVFSRNVLVLGKSAFDKSVFGYVFVVFVFYSSLGRVYEAGQFFD